MKSERAWLLAMGINLGFGGAALAAVQDPDVLTGAPPNPAASAAARVPYPPEFFAPFAPQTALDMVSRVPGFSIDGGDGRRGFGGAGGNVLIDGARPSAKSQSVHDILARIPAAQVARIDLVRGAGADASEAGGQSVLVDIIRTPAAFGGLWEIEAEMTESGRISPRGSASVNGQLGAAKITAGVDRYLQERPLFGARTLRDGEGRLTGTRTDATPRTWRELEGTAALETPLLGGVAKLNAQAERWVFDTVLASQGFTASGARSERFDLSIDERRRGREIGGDFERALGASTLKLVALDTIGWYANDESTARYTETDAPAGTIRQSRRNRSAERILRGSLGWTWGAHTLEAGLEGALNELENRLTLIDDRLGAPALPASNVLVEETRGEAFVTDVWTLAPGWTLESGLTVETSVLSQSGDTKAETELTYWKPSAQLAKAFGARNQARVKLSREVGQLDFGDFASSAALADDRVVAGNPDLRPFAAWRLEAGLDLRFDGDAAIALTYTHDAIEDAQDTVPIRDPASGARFDGPGNIGDGESDTLALTAEAPLRFLPGARLEVSGFLARSEVTDPTTLAARSASGFADSELEVAFRQDLTAQRLAWGLSVFKRAEVEFFRLAERETYEEGPFLDAFVETTALGGAKVRFFGANLLDSTFERERRFSSPDRTGQLSGVERRERSFGRFVGLQISATI